MFIITQEIVKQCDKTTITSNMSNILSSHFRDNVLFLNQRGDECIVHIKGTKDKIGLYQELIKDIIN